MLLLIKIPDVPYGALALIVKDLISFGCETEFINKYSGIIVSISGKIFWNYEPNIETLSIFLLEDSGHFSKTLLKGGARQITFEAIERYRNGNKVTNTNLLE